MDIVSTERACALRAGVVMLAPTRSVLRTAAVTMVSASRTTNTTASACATKDGRAQDAILRHARTNALDMVPAVPQAYAPAIQVGPVRTAATDMWFTDVFWRTEPSNAWTVGVV